MTRNSRVYCPAGQVENIPCPVRADFMYISVYLYVQYSIVQYMYSIRTESESVYFTKIATDNIHNCHTHVCYDLSIDAILLKLYNL